MKNLIFCFLFLSSFSFATAQTIAVDDNGQINSSYWSPDVFQVSAETENMFADSAKFSSTDGEMKLNRLESLDSLSVHNVSCYIVHQDDIKIDKLLVKIIPLLHGHDLSSEGQPNRNNSKSISLYFKNKGGSDRLWVHELQ